MFDRMSSYLTGLAAVIVLPLTVTISASQSGSAHQTNLFSFVQQPFRIGVKIATVTRPLDLKTLSVADFGDGEQIR